MTASRRSTLIVVLGVLVVLLATVSLMAGRVWTPLAALSDRTDPRWSIIFELRLPRTILAIAVGGALGLSGAAMQGYTRNPLADPAALGVSSTAALGAVLTIYFGAGAQAPWVTSSFAMLGAVAGVGLLMGLAGTASSTVTFILAGVILQTIAGAGVTLALSLAPNPWAVNEIVNWLMGSLADRSIEEVKLAAPFIIVGSVLMLLLGRALDALTLGETGARSMGVNLDATRWILAVGTALAVGASVAVTGIIGFVGLITPHLLRPLIGSRPSALLWPSTLGGAVLLLAADILVRLTPGANEVKLGVLTAAIGGPFFFGLLISSRRRLA